MAGHFILKNITVSDLHTATGKPGITWSNALAHAPGTGIGPFLGWCLQTRQVLEQALGNIAIANRDNLPPHRYLLINAWQGLAQETQHYLMGAAWDQFLIRPTGGGLGLTALAAGANPPWNQGNKSAALRAQCQAGGVSIEVYYLSGIEMS
ncbi:hypothetical protein G4177_10170 [Corallococcus sp. ZKHCc1 1396]|uniref:Uncharacterized protein n=1 Tax=Corallococcus soli TaxID=2710757 RepID=A0ABR9PKW6_9BACT|nr:hypothetical protein [Corallococcus soli]MBE4748529.1 hypothetical protein [Corallococcus soli]